MKALNLMLTLLCYSLLWFLIHHSRRKIMHFNVTEHPTAAWVIQQLRESLPYDTAPCYVVFDRDSIFAERVVSTIRPMGIQPKRIAARSPWQNGVAERWIGSCRRELLDRVMILHDGQLRRLLREYVSYYSEDRCHLTLEKDARTCDRCNRGRVAEAGSSRKAEWAPSITATPGERLRKARENTSAQDSSSWGIPLKGQGTRIRVALYGRHSSEANP